MRLVDRLKRKHNIYILENSPQRFIVEAYGRVEGMCWFLPLCCALLGIMPLLTGNTSLNLAGFSIFFLLLAGLFFYHMLRRYIRATIVVADKTEKQLYVLRELFGTRQKVLFLAGFINVKGVRVIHHPGSEGSVSSDELVIDFIHRWPFQVCKVSYENLKEIRQQLVDCIFEGDDPRKRGDLK